MRASGRPRPERGRALARDKRRGRDPAGARPRRGLLDVIDPFPGGGDRGRRRPHRAAVSLREKIRAAGLTFDAIAAEAVRYA